MSDQVREAIRRFRDGEIVVVPDDGDRENEGDLVCAASLCTPEKMAFIIRHSCRIVCTPLTETRARALNLAPMVATNDAPLGTAFTVSVDVLHGLTTGISAEQRSNTARALANSNMGAADFVRPGHRSDSTPRASWLRSGRSGSISRQLASRRTRSSASRSRSI
jgi:3,4-dihydroxy 2-butanone 4-phosphate synthase/GTP cyclohydrolase II